MEVIPAAQLARNAALATAAVGLAPDLRKRVEVMAEHVAKNGPSFERTVKERNKDVPGMDFLLSGEGAEYYQQCLLAHRERQPAPLAPGPVAAGPAGPAGQAAAAPQGGLVELLRRWPEPYAPSLGPDGDRQLSEVVSSLAAMASRDAIRAGRAWIEANVAAAGAIAGNLVRRMVHLQTFAHRLHVLFLLHDVMQTELTRQDPTMPIIAAFRPHLAWVLRPAFQLAHSVAPNGEECGKVRKLLQLWGERGVLSPREAEEVRALMEAPQLPAAPAGAPSQAAALCSAGHPGLRPLAPGLQPLGGLPRPQLPSAGPAGALFGAAGAGFTPGGQLVLPTHPPGAPPGFTGMLAGPPAAGQRLAFTPESVPVGVMALMLKQVSKRGKDLHTAFVPYKPLDPLYTPQVLPPVAPPSQRLMERLGEFYEVLGDAAKPPAKAAALPPPDAEAPGGGGGARGGARSRSPRGGDAAAAPTPARTAASAAVPPPANLD